MKPKKIVLISFLAACLLTGCREKQPTNVIIAPKPVAEKPQGPQRMEETNQKATVAWIGKNYTIEVKRAPADSLPKVKDESGKVYYDNLIRVRVTREDGSEFFNRVFSKRSFNDCLDDNSRQNGALLGIVFVEAQGDNLVFGASVGSPDALSDEYIPMVLTITRMGDVAIRKDTELDSARHDGSADEEGV
ncbi:MAG: DUF4738 domain-containing protein [Prevotella sp.]|nr:DUF4738 domain-containing protein [Prevotella sp.]